MCFVITPQFSKPMKAVQDIPIKKIVHAVITRKKDGVQVVMKSPYMEQEYKTLFVPRKDVRKRVFSHYHLSIQLPHVELGISDDQSRISRGYHSYPLNRMIETSFTRISNTYKDNRSVVDQIEIGVPAEGYIPQGSTFYFNQVDLEYVSEDISLSIEPTDTTIAEEDKSYTMHAVEVDRLLALIAYRVLYSKSSKWYDRELTKLENGVLMP